MDQQPPRGRPISGIWLWIVLLGVAAFLLIQSPEWLARNDVDYSFFLAEVQRGNVDEVMFQGASVRGKFKDAPQRPQAAKGEKLSKDFRTVVPPVEGGRLLQILELHGVRVAAREDKTSTGLALLVTLLPWVLLVGVFFWMSRRICGGIDRERTGW